MSALDKLINLLEKLRQEDPAFHDKAAKALDVLIDADEEESLPPPSSEPDPEPEPEPDPELEPEIRSIFAPVDDSRAEITVEEAKLLLGAKQATFNYINALGLLTQNYEADKEDLLEKIEEMNDAINELKDKIKEKYGLDPEAEYYLELPKASGERPLFVKGQEG